MENNETAYCVKCHKKIEVKEGRKLQTKKRVWMIKGICPICGTKVCKFLKSSGEEDKRWSSEPIIS